MTQKHTNDASLQKEEHVRVADIDLPFEKADGKDGVFRFPAVEENEE